MLCTWCISLTVNVHPQGRGNYQFDDVIYCNIGDVQATGNQPITFIRQLITVCLSPAKYFKTDSNGTAVHSNTKERITQLLAQLSEGAPDNQWQGLQQLVNGMSPEMEERVHDILDDIPGDVKERANILLNDIGGRSLGKCPLIIIDLLTP